MGRRLPYRWIALHLQESARLGARLVFLADMLGLAVPSLPFLAAHAYLGARSLWILRRGQGRKQNLKAAYSTAADLRQTYAASYVTVKRLERELKKAS